MLHWELQHWVAGYWGDFHRSLFRETVYRKFTNLKCTPLVANEVINMKQTRSVWYKCNTGQWFRTSERRHCWLYTQKYWEMGLWIYLKNLSHAVWLVWKLQTVISTRKPQIWFTPKLTPGTICSWASWNLIPILLSLEIYMGFIVKTGKCSPSGVQQNAMAHRNIIENINPFPR